MKNPKISVIGLGYVGLCTAVGFASKRYSVLASDNDSEKVLKIQEGIPPFHEPNLLFMLKKTITTGHLKCLTNQTEKAVLETEITFVAVGTPSKSDGSIDLQFIKTVVHEIGKALCLKSKYHVVVIKSSYSRNNTKHS